MPLSQKRTVVNFTCLLCSWTCTSAEAADLHSLTHSDLFFPTTNDLRFHYPGTGLARNSWHQNTTLRKWTTNFESSDAELLCLLFNYFNKLLFLGILGFGNVKVTLETMLPGAFGMTSSLGDGCGSKMDIQIRILKQTLPCRRKRFLKYAGVLLHEMTHAFLVIYVAEEKLESRTGHGALFLDFVVWIRTIMRNDLRLKVNLGIGRSLMSEIHACKSREEVKERFGDTEKWGFRQDVVALQMMFERWRVRVKSGELGPVARKSHEKEWKALCVKDIIAESKVLKYLMKMRPQEGRERIIIGSAGFIAWYRASYHGTFY